MENTKAVSQVETKEVAEVDDEELLSLINQNAKLQEKESEGDSIKASYILLAKSGTKALKKSQEELYISGLSIGDFFLQKEKVVLGDVLQVVPLAFITLYDEMENDTKDAKFFGVWNKEQAGQFDLADGSYFNRQLPNGHILKPKNWVMVEVLGHPEIENAVIAFKSTGSRIWKKWKEDAKTRASSSATLVYEIKEESYNNDDYDWTDVGFNYVESLLETDKMMALHCLKKSNALRESYERNTLIGNHDLNKTNKATATVAYIEDSSDIEGSDDTEELGF